MANHQKARTGDVNTLFLFPAGPTDVRTALQRFIPHQSAPMSTTQAGSLKVHLTNIIAKKGTTTPQGLSKSRSAHTPGFLDNLLIAEGTCKVCDHARNSSPLPRSGPVQVCTAQTQTENSAVAALQKLLPYKKVHGIREIYIRHTKQVLTHNQNILLSK